MLDFLTQELDFLRLKSHFDFVSSSQFTGIPLSVLSTIALQKKPSHKGEDFLFF